MVAPIFTGQEEAVVAGRYAAGESLYRIAREYRCGYQAVKRAVLAQGIELWKSATDQKLTPKQREDAVNLYLNSDPSLGDAAKEFGITGPTLAGMLVRRGRQRP